MPNSSLSFAAATINSEFTIVATLVKIKAKFALKKHSAKLATEKNAQTKNA